MDYLWLDRLKSLLYFDKAGELKPSGSLQMFQLGTVAVIFSLLGKGFYDTLAKEGLKMFHDEGAYRVFAAVEDSHLRLMTRALKTCKITHHGRCVIREHDFNFICIEALDEEDTQLSLF